MENGNGAVTPGVTIAAIVEQQISIIVIEAAKHLINGNQCEQCELFGVYVCMCMRVQFTALRARTKD